MVYCPAHRGIAGNEWADGVAKAHLGADPEDTAAVIAPSAAYRQTLTLTKSEYHQTWIHDERKF